MQLTAMRKILRRGPIPCAIGIGQSAGRKIGRKIGRGLCPVCVPHGGFMPFRRDRVRKIRAKFGSDICSRERVYKIGREIGRGMSFPVFVPSGEVVPFRRDRVGRIKAKA